MQSYFTKKLNFLLFTSLTLLTLFSCSLISSREELQRDELIYNNDFESGDIDAIGGAQLMTFNNTTVLGNYNNDGFNVHLDNIGAHDYIYISFDLYIHDSWDGNKNGFETNDQPDSWFIELRPDLEAYPGEQFGFWKTTFSNSVCNSTYCLRQSYPNTYPFENRPQISAAKLLPGLCSLVSSSNGTAMYKIEKGFPHSGNAFIIRFFDELYQPNAVNEKCDESWSLDNLKIRAITFE